VDVDQPIPFHKPNRKKRSEKMDHPIPFTRHPLSVLTSSLNGILVPPACLVIDTLHKFTHTDLSFYLIYSFCRDCILDISYSLFSQH
jgi:hypothetical protein